MWVFISVYVGVALITAIFVGANNSKTKNCIDDILKEQYKQGYSDGAEDVLDRFKGQTRRKGTFFVSPLTLTPQDRDLFYKIQKALTKLEEEENGVKE